MNRAEFMGQLERLLYDIPEYERQDALDYYNDYFDEAGPENERELIHKLGSPGKVAAIIKANLEKGQEHGEFTEHGYRETAGEEELWTPAKRPAEEREQKRSFHSRTYTRRGMDGGEQRERARAEQESGGMGWNESTSQDSRGTWDGGAQREYDWEEPGEGRRRGAGMGTLFIIVLVFASPVLLGIGGGALGVLFGLFSALVGLVFGALGAGIGLLAGGAIGIIKGVFLCVSSPAVGIVTMGLSFLSVGAGLVLMLLFIWGLKLIPRFVRWAIDLVSRVIHRIWGGIRG